MQPSRDGPSSTVISPTATPSASSRRHASRARVVAWAADWMAAGRIGGADAGTAPSRRARAGGHALVRCAWARHRLSLRVFDRFRCGEGFRERVLARGGPRLSVGVRLAAAHRELFGSRATTARREGRASGRVTARARASCCTAKRPSACTARWSSRRCSVARCRCSARAEPRGGSSRTSWRSAMASCAWPAA